MPDYTPISDLINITREHEMQLVGSTAINGEGEDIDIAVKAIINDNFTQSDARELVGELAQAGCTIGGGGHYDIGALEDQFTSLKRGRYNLLLCFNERAWNRFTKGRDACILLKNLGVDMSDKQVRVAVHALAAGMSLQDVQRDVDRVPRRGVVGQRVVNGILDLMFR